MLQLLFIQPSYTAFYSNHGNKRVYTKLWRDAASYLFSCWLLHTGLLGLLFSPAGCVMFLQKVSWLSTDYMALHPRRQLFSHTEFISFRELNTRADKLTRTPQAALRLFVCEVHRFVWTMKEQSWSHPTGSENHDTAIPPAHWVIRDGYTRQCEILYFDAYIIICCNKCLIPWGGGGVDVYYGIQWMAFFLWFI
jgi:hypothetical protein